MGWTCGTNGAQKNTGFRWEIGGKYLWTWQHYLDPKKDECRVD